jgi:vacuolar-type H+-ATPase subunit H
MKLGKTVHEEKEQVFFDEVHQAEEEIDHFLTRKREEADRILKEAQQQAEQEREKTLLDCQEETAAREEELVSLAEKEAADILKEASSRLEREKERLEEIRPMITEKIMEHLLRVNS